MALARLRQLSAHEVGHTIGLAHNFAASTNGRSSVMDYPHPYVTLKDGEVDFSDAYDVGIGAWDKQTIKYGYSDFAPGQDEATELAKILAENESLGLRYISDADARPQGSSQPNAHLWDNGANPVNEISRLFTLRKHALANFSEANIPVGMPMSELESVLVPVYLMHRYQVEAVAKMIGGYNYSYSVRGTKEASKITPVAQKHQVAATRALLGTLSPEILAVPSNIQGLIPPSAMGYRRNRELFNTQNGSGFDPLGMAVAACDNTLKFMLHHHRLARIAEQNALYAVSRDISLENYLSGLYKELNERVSSATSNYHRELAQIAEKRYVAHLLQVAANAGASEQVRAAANEQLLQIAGMSSPDLEGPNAGHMHYLEQQIKQFFRDPSSVKVAPAPALPDGSPIGCGEFH